MKYGNMNGDILAIITIVASGIIIALCIILLVVGIKR